MARTRSFALAVSFAALSSGPALGAPEQASPSGRLAAQLDHASLRSIAMGERVSLSRVALPSGEVVDLSLARFDVLDPDARLVLGTADGEVAMARPDVVLLSGSVVGDPRSIAFVSVSPYGTNGFIDHDGGVYSISTGAYERGKDLAGALAIADVAQLAIEAQRAGVAAPAPECGFDPDDLELSPFGPMIEPAPEHARGGTPCRVASIAIDSDWEYTSRIFGGDADASAAYAVTLIAAIGEIYDRDVGVKLTIPYLRMWDADVDPYNQADGDPLILVRNHWRSNFAGQPRNVTHMLTGRTDVSYGGVAYLSVLCDTQWGYGVSAYHNGFFPYPIQDHHAGNWDLTVTAHELGHNFGTGHTHDSYNPVIDGCGNGDCSAAFGGTIMSYCHTCPGGMSNIVMGFHPRVQDVIVGYMDAIEPGCDMNAFGVTAVSDAASTYEGAAIDIDVLANDAAQSCDPVALGTFDPTSGGGASVTLVPGAGPGGRDLLRYTPAGAFTGLDSFSYSLDTGESAVVGVDVAALRDPDVRINPAPGLAVDYYALSNPSALPNFDALTPYASDVSANVNYASTDGEFMTSGRSDGVGAVLTGYVNVFIDGLYTLYTNSDDGSRLLIGDEVVVSNDGLHGMQERSGQIALHAGWHKVRIEFFENGGGAGLIASIAGPSLSKTPLTQLILSHEQGGGACSPVDLAEPFGVLDFSDVSAFLVAFGGADPAADLAEPFGTFDFSDVLSFLAQFGAGCP